jgi:GNAT superfamily N-acetyltransferase
VTFSRPELLTADHDLSKFDCGEPSLNDWLTMRALTNNASGATRTYVTTDGLRVVGYYSIATGGVERTKTPGKVRRNQPEMVPVIVLARLAVDRTCERRGLGSQLLRDAIVRSVRIADQVGVRAILVHALHQEARQFYLRFDFEPSPTDALDLLLVIQDARAAINAD